MELFSTDTERLICRRINKSMDVKYDQIENSFGRLCRQVGRRRLRFAPRRTGSESKKNRRVIHKAGGIGKPRREREGGVYDVLRKAGRKEIKVEAGGQT